MPIEVGHVEALFRYPVKSMRGELLEIANLGWHGLDGDRRLAFRQMNDHSGFPWLTASKLPDLLLFTPQPREAQEESPRISARPLAKTSPSSETPWPPKSDVATALPCR